MTDPIERVDAAVLALRVGHDAAAEARRAALKPVQAALWMLRERRAGANALIADYRARGVSDEYMQGQAAAFKRAAIEVRYALKAARRTR